MKPSPKVADGPDGDLINFYDLGDSDSQGYGPDGIAIDASAAPGQGAPDRKVDADFFLPPDDPFNEDDMKPQQ